MKVKLFLKYKIKNETNKCHRFLSKSSFNFLPYFTHLTHLDPLELLSRFLIADMEMNDTSSNYTFCENLPTPDILHIIVHRGLLMGLWVLWSMILIVSFSLAGFSNSHSSALEHLRKCKTYEEIQKQIQKQIGPPKDPIVIPIPSLDFAWCKRLFE